MDIHKIATELSADPIAVNNWRMIYSALELPPAEEDNLNKSVKLELITNFDLFTRILRKWESVNGNNATVQNLETVLRNLDLAAAAGILITSG